MVRRGQEENHFHMKKSEIINILAGRPKNPKKKVKNLSYPAVGDKPYISLNKAERFVREGQYQWFGKGKTKIYAPEYTDTPAYQLQSCHDNCKNTYT